MLWGGTGIWQRHSPNPELNRCPLAGSLSYAWFNGGPVVAVWGWVFVWALTMTVICSLAEISSACPVIGALYYARWVGGALYYARWGGSITGKYRV